MNSYNVNSDKIFNIKERVNMNNIKSKYIMKKIFENLKKNKELFIINHNKEIQKRLDINIDDFKNYSNIEIEIIPFKNVHGKFIDLNEEERPYYHIYFDDNKNEVKTTYLYEDNVSKIRVSVDYQIDSFYGLFYRCCIIESVNFKKFYRNNIKNMCSMFHRCKFLKEINLSNFNTDNVTNMGYMFHKCQSLEKLDLSNFNTSKVTDMPHMFSRCISLKELNAINFNTDSVTNMCFMFHRCYSLKELYINNFNTKNVKNMYKMFYRCQSLKELNLSKFNFSNIKYIDSIFGGCSYELKKRIDEHLKNLNEKEFNNLYPY